MGHWLSDRGLPSFVAEAFKEHLVNGLLASDLTCNDLASMGIQDASLQNKVLTELLLLFSPQHREHARSRQAPRSPRSAPRSPRSVRPQSAGAARPSPYANAVPFRRKRPQTASAGLLRRQGSTSSEVKAGKAAPDLAAVRSLAADRLQLLRTSQEAQHKLEELNNQLSAVLHDREQMQEELRMLRRELRASEPEQELRAAQAQLAELGLKLKAAEQELSTSKQEAAMLRVALVSASNRSCCCSRLRPAESLQERPPRPAVVAAESGALRDQGRARPEAAVSSVPKGDGQVTVKVHLAPLEELCHNFRLEVRDLVASRLRDPA